MITVSATFVRNHISETLEMARQEPIAVESRGEPEFVIVSATEYKRITEQRPPRQFGYAKHLLGDFDVDELLARPIPGIEDYM